MSELLPLKVYLFILTDIFQMKIIVMIIIITEVEVCIKILYCRFLHIFSPLITSKRHIRKSAYTVNHIIKLEPGSTRILKVPKCHCFNH